MKKFMTFATVLASLCLAGAALAETIDKASGLVPGAPSLDRNYVVTEELDLSETTLASSNTYKMVTLPEFYLPTHVVVSLEDVAVTNSCNVQFYWTGGGSWAAVSTNTYAATPSSGTVAAWTSGLVELGQVDGPVTLGFKPGGTVPTAGKLTFGVIAHQIGGF